MIRINNLNVSFPMRDVSDFSFRKSLFRLLTFNRPPPHTYRVIKELSIEILKGERVGLIGKNGAGKSSFLRVLNGVYPVTSGSVWIGGSVVALLDIAAGMDSEISGLDNIFLKGLFLGVSKREMSRNVDDIVDFSGLGDRIFDPLHTYSSGMQMRLAFSTITSIHADILLMDEWLSVGDIDFTKKAESRLQAMMGRSQILVLASHSRELLARTCSKIIWLEDGSVKDFSDSTSVLQNYFD